ncbi:MAG TPA: fumarylacetoacetase [Gemmatimonadales bacterium]|nr:fumarylacetoacetase [Gemmatimonadales bacterium]
MTREINDTHDPALRSWVESANQPGHDFPIQNLPFGVFRRRGERQRPRVGVAIGDRIVDVIACRRAAFLSGAAEACDAPNLNRLMAAGPEIWSALRSELSQVLRDGSYRAREMREAEDEFFVSPSEVEMLLPAAVGDYTDFYASIHHATNVGSMFRPDNPLLPNYRHVPIGYHGRASSLVPSGTPVRRPSGQTKAPDAPAPQFGPCRMLDYEVEVGCLVGPGNRLGEPIGIADAEANIFGVVLVNDWSARDIQGWEYQPLGPFLAKNFATTVSPWVVTLEALAPFRTPAAPRGGDEPAPLPYLSHPSNDAQGGIALTVEAWIETPGMRQRNEPAALLSRGSFARMYWTLAQMLAHHASNGCNLQPGDLIASGTVSGPEREERGCLLELTWRGAEPLTLPGGESRRFLEDGDEVILRGYCEREGAARIGLGEARGRVDPAGR